MLIHLYIIIICVKCVNQPLRVCHRARHVGQAALGLSTTGARRLTVLLQTLTKSELRRPLLHHDWWLLRHISACCQRCKPVGSFDLNTCLKAVYHVLHVHYLFISWDIKRARRLKVLQSPSEEKRQAARAQKADRLAAPRPPLPETAGELFGLPADAGRLVLKCLILTEQNTLRAVSVGAKNLVDVEICRLAAAFTYEPALFDARLRCTRSGRVMGKGDAGRSRRFLGFLKRHANLLQRLDVRRAPSLGVQRNCLSFLEIKHTV